MTDTPGWVSPSSSGSDPEDTRPPVATPPGPDGTSAAPAPDASTAPAPADRVPDEAGRVTPPPYSGGPYGDPQAPQPGWGAPPGWGAQPGWGRGTGGAFPGWGAPQSPKPGVIPLRPLGVGEILDGSISTTRKHWRTVLGLSLIVSVLVETVLSAVNWWSQHDAQNVAALAALGVSALLSTLAVLVLTALLTVVVSKAILGEQVSPAAAWRSARPQLPRLIGLSMLLGLIIAGIVAVGAIPLVVLLFLNGTGPVTVAIGGPILLGSVAVAVWMAVQLSLATPALMLEKQGVLAALARSRRLVRGAWWRVLGVSLLGSLLTSILSSMIAVPFTLLAAATGDSPLNALGGTTDHPQPLSALAVLAIGGIIGSTLSYPIQAGINVLLYVDQRIRREALDIELARAAGLAEYGGTGWAGRPAPPTGA